MTENLRTRYVVLGDSTSYIDGHPWRQRTDIYDRLDDEHLAVERTRTLQQRQPDKKFYIRKYVTTPEGALVEKQTITVEDI